MNRTCSDCTQCCKLVPVKELDKAAGQRCIHQSRKGCGIYNRRPMSCALWSCRWLTDPATAALSRPDRSHYVIDAMPDFISVDDADTGERIRIPVIQIWIDPAYPDAHRDPKLRAYLEQQQSAALIRFGNERGIVLFPPFMFSDGQWHERDSRRREPQHTHDEITAVTEQFG